MNQISCKISPKFTTFDSTYDYKQWADFIMRVIEYAYEAYEIDSPLQVQFKPTTRTYEKREYDLETQKSKFGLVFGIKQLKWEYENYAIEYKSVEYMLPRYKVSGYQALLYIVLHEFAHILTDLHRVPVQLNKYNWRKRRDVHGVQFQTHYRGLLKLFDASQLQGDWQAFK